MQDIK